MKYRNLIYTTLILLLFGCDNKLTTEFSREQYPAVFEMLTEEERQSLITEYKNNNDFDFPCASVNEYGFNDSRICLDREILRVEINYDEKQRLHKMAADFLERNKKFTNVTDPEQLDIRLSYGRPGCVKCDGSGGDIATIRWIISYNRQMYEGLEVEYTAITVFMDSEKVYAVNGHWYSDIIVPPVDQLDHGDAQELLIGKEFTYYDWSGEKTYTIAEDSFREFEGKAIFPYETERGLELRVSLIVEAGIWHFYIDSTTGELVHKKQIYLF